MAQTSKDTACLAPTLRDKIAPCLPKAWRKSFVLEPEKDLLVIRVDTGPTGLHVFEIRPQRGDMDGIITSDRFVYRYRLDDPRLDPRGVEYAYHRIFSEFEKREDDWADYFPTESLFLRPPLEADAATDHPPTTLFIQETTLYKAVAGHVGAEAIREALKAYLAKEIPVGPAEIQLYFRNPCVQSCEFCTEPMMRPHVKRITSVLRNYHEMGLDLVGLGIFSMLLDLLGEREGPTSLCVTGNDWTRHPRMEEILSRLEREEKVPIRLIGPHASLSDAPFARRIARIPMLREIRVSIFSPLPEKHDEITGTTGAGQQILQAVANLKAAGVSPAVNTVLTRKALSEFPGLAHWIEEQDLKITLLAFVPDVLPDTFMGFKGEWDSKALLAPYSEMLETLDSLSEKAKSHIDSVHGFPLCAIPEDLAHLVRGSGISEEAEPEIMLAPCTNCAAKPQCSGVPKTYADHYGDRGLTPR